MNRPMPLQTPQLLQKRLLPKLAKLRLLHQLKSQHLKSQAAGYLQLKAANKQSIIRQLAPIRQPSARGSYL